MTNIRSREKLWSLFIYVLSHKGDNTNYLKMLFLQKTKVFQNRCSGGGVDN